MKLAWITDNSIVRGYRKLKTRITSGLIEDSKASFPPGFQSNPSPTYVAILSETQSSDEPVIIGYLDGTAIEDLGIGDSVMYSTSEGGTKVAQIRLKNDGSAIILGEGDNAVRFQKLDDSLKNWQTQIQNELTQISLGIASAGGSYTPGILNIDISQSKVSEIKLP